MKLLIYKVNYLLYAFIVLLINLSCSDATDTVLNTLEETSFLNESYGSDSDQKYDIYLPEGRSVTTTKVFILVHGGGWTQGDKNDMEGYVSHLQTSFPNYAIVNINYRLASIGNSPFPMQIDDIKTIINQLKQKSSEYQISTNYAFIGISAGAHLSLLYSYAHNDDNNVKMVCSIVGPTNFTDTSYTDTTNAGFTALFNSFQLITGVNYSGNIEYYKSISPYHRVNNSAPPTILFYGGLDPLIPTTQGISMREKLNELGVINEFTLYTNEGHLWVGENLLDTATKLDAFITSNF